MPSTKSKILNILGFMNKLCCVRIIFFKGSMDSDVVVACFDEFSKKTTKKTIVFLDNASIHKSNIFLDNISEWEENGLFIFYIPPYSPELNLIEILWKRIKCEWLDFSAYESFSSLRKNLEHVLANIGKIFLINFV